MRSSSGPPAARTSAISRCRCGAPNDRAYYPHRPALALDGGTNGTWHFLTIDGAAGEALSATALMRRLERTIGGFGSLKVRATIGDTVFATSVFPSREQGWMLPVKAAVRRSEDLAEGDLVTVTLEL
ncbi:DUF1905 domain-containing protein [Novosphingobium arvoryzae]|nr:DUF1905 domain-containing protein [Novosphingobium arvoryzae]